VAYMQWPRTSTPHSKPQRAVQEYLTHTWPEGAIANPPDEAHYNKHGNYSLVALQRLLFWHWSLPEYQPQQPMEIQVMSGSAPIPPGQTQATILARAPHHTELMLHTTHNSLTGTPSCPHYLVLKQAATPENQWYLVDSLHQQYHPGQVKLMTEQDWGHISGTIITINPCTAQRMIEACEFPDNEPPCGLPTHIHPPPTPPHPRPLPPVSCP
jgi:hypothetical protein